MNIRFALSKLASAEARQTAARGLLLFCAAGYAVTLVAMFAGGTGLRRWLFALLGWALFVYLPLRILLEAFQSIAPGMRKTLIGQAAARADRYASRTSVELIVDGLSERGVVMPRIATPAQSLRAKAGAVAVLLRAGGPGAASLRAAATRCLVTVERWIGDLAAWSTREVPSNIQARWADLRALVALIALSKILLGAVADQSGEAVRASEAGTPTADGFLDSCFDYCDQLALEVEVVPWTEPSLGLPVGAERVARIRAAWTQFSQTEPPALEARAAFVSAVLEPGSRNREPGTA